MFKQLVSCTGLAILLLTTGAARADEASVRKAVEAWMGGKVDGVKKTSLLGLYEIQSGNEIYYTDEKVSLIIDGSIIDTRTRTNLTQERLNKLSAIKFSDLPLELAVKTVRGDGKRVIATFEDPNCGYCKKLAKDVLTLKDVTVYTFLLPVLGDDSYEKSKAIWCAPDKSRAWVDWMTAGKIPPAAPAKCDLAGLNKSAQLGGKLRINGTPAIFFANGERVGGYIPAAEIEKRFGSGG